MGRWSAHSVVQLITLVVLVPIPAAHAILVSGPELSIDPKTGVLSNLRVGHLASAFTFGDSDSSGDTADKVPVDWKEPLSSSGRIEASFRNLRGEAEWRARAQAGNLKALTRAKVENGAVIVHSDVYLQFLDVVQITEEGKLSLSLKIGSHGVRDEVHPASSAIGAFSSAHSDFFVWPYGGAMPTVGQLFNFYDYRGVTWTAAGPVSTEPLGPLDYPVGSRWWVMGQLSVNSVARGNSVLGIREPHTLETMANFFGTVEFYFLPDPSTPDVRFNSATGFSYLAPVPEPATWLMMLLGVFPCAVQAHRRYRGSAARKCGLTLML